MVDSTHLGTGRRKTSVARVRLKAGNGNLTVNGRTVDDYFQNARRLRDVREPLEVTGTLGKVDVIARLHGGGPTGQSGALRLGIARALENMDPGLRAILREHGMLTRDARMVERKKYGRRGARRGFQFSKR